MILTETTIKNGRQWLMQSDRFLAPVIARSSACSIRPHTDYYHALVAEIIGQQLSVKAAAAIRSRFYQVFGSEQPGPKAIIAQPPENLRAAGLSWAKVRYIQDLAQHMIEERIDFSAFDSLSNEEIITQLTDVKGIGIWTAHMFLIFCMGRSDVLPWGDLGIRNGIQKLYRLDETPDRATIEQIATTNNWHPYQSLASWYIWQSLDNMPVA